MSEPTRTAPPSTATPEATHGVAVRQAVLADLEALSGLLDRYRVFQGRPSDCAAARAFLQARFEHGESAIFIAHVGGEPGGFAQLYPSFSTVALARVFVLNDLYVAEAGRRRGVASALLAALEAYAWSFGAVRVTLNVAHGNAGAQALYERRGWQRDAEYHMYHRLPPAAR